MICDKTLNSMNSQQKNISRDNFVVNLEHDSALFDTPIHRYLSLNHFIDMMEHQRLYVNRRKDFNDATERYIPFYWPGFLEPVGENIPPQPDRTQYYQDIRKEYSRWANMPTLCWTLATNENYLMWKGYTGEIGVCIVSTIRKFITSIQDSKDFKKKECIIHLGQMLYNGFSSINTESLPFWKGREFASENELRFYFAIEGDTDKDNHVFIPINRSMLINKLIITPFVCSTTAKVLADMLRTKYKINVSSSKIRIQS